MKRTLAFLIAVLMVAVMIPATVLTAAGQAIGDLWEQLSSLGYDESTPQAEPEGGSGTPVRGADDKVEVLDANGAPVGYYETLAEADAVLLDGYTVKLLKSITGDYAWGSARLTVTDDGTTVTHTKADPISFTVEGAEGVTVTGSWRFDYANDRDTVTVKNVTIQSADAAKPAIVVDMYGDGSNSTGNTMLSLTLENCTVTAAGDAISVNGAHVSVMIVGDDTAVSGGTADGATEGAAVVMNTVAGTNGKLYIGGGAFTSVAGDAAVKLTGTAVAFIGGGRIVGQKDVALSLGDGTAAHITGGEIGLVSNIVATEPLAAIKVGAATLQVAGGTVMAPFAILKTANDSAVAVESTDSVWGIYATSADAAVTLYNADIAYACEGHAFGAADSGVTAAVGAFAESAEVAADGFVVTTVSLKADLTGADVQVKNGGEVVAAFDVTDATTLGAASKLVADGGTLQWLGELGFKAAIGAMFGGMPNINVTLDGGGFTHERVDSNGNYVYGGATDANVTLTNVTFKQTTGGIVALTDQYSYGTLTLGDGFVGDSGVAPKYPVQVLYNNRLVIGEGAHLKFADPSAAGTAIYVQGGEVYVQGGTVEIGNVLKTTTFGLQSQGRSKTVSLSDGTSVTLSHQPKQPVLSLESGTVYTPAGLSQLFYTVNSGVLPEFTVKSAVKFLAASNPTDTEGFSISENPIELLNEKGEHVSYHNSIRDAALLVQDGYTVKVRANHLELKSLYLDIDNKDWTLDATADDADGRYEVYLPLLKDYTSGTTIFGRGLWINGSNTTVTLKNLVLYTANYGICIWDGSRSAVVAEDVMVYACGTSTTDCSTYLALGSSYAAYRVQNRGNELVILGDRSGAAIGGCEDTDGDGKIDIGKIIYNRGYLSIYGGYFESPLSTIVQTEANGKTYIGGGTFKTTGAATGYTVCSYGEFANAANSETSSAVVITGGTFINNGTSASVVRVTANGTNNGSHTWVFGGRFYANGTGSANTVFSKGNAAQWVLNLLGGEYYVAGLTEGNGMFDSSLTAATTKTWASNIDQPNGTTRSYTCGAYYDVEYGNYELTALDADDYGAYEPSVEAGDPVALLNEGVSWTKEAVVLKSSVDKSTLAYKVYGSEHVEGNVIELYGDDSITTALMAVGFYDGVIELQQDITRTQGARLRSRYLGRRGHITLTSAEGQQFTYDVNADSANAYRFFIYGYVTFENIVIYDGVNKPVEVSNVGTTTNGATVLELGEGAEVVCTSGGIQVNSSTKVIVQEGAYVYASAYSAGTSLIRAQANSKVEIYGSVGYDPAGNPTNAKAISFEGTAGGATVDVYSTARLGTSSETVSLVGASGAATATSVLNVYDGAELYAAWCYIKSSAGDLTVNGGSWTLHATKDTTDNSAMICLDTTAKMTINSGTFAMTAVNHVITAEAMFWVKNTAELTINGGTFSTEGLVGRGMSSMFLMSNSSVVTVNGGQFDIGHQLSSTITAAERTAIEGSHGMRGFYVNNSSTLTINGGVLQTFAEYYNSTDTTSGLSPAQASIVEVQRDATFTMNGGELYHRAGGIAAIYDYGRSGTTKIYGGYVESNAQYTVYTAGYNSAHGANEHGIYIWGGEFVQQAPHECVSSAVAVVGCASNGWVEIHGGTFINNADGTGASDRVLSKSSTDGELIVTGGIFMATAAQKYFVYTDVGSTAADESFPMASILINGATTPTMYYKGRTYYVLAYKGGYLLAPEVEPTVEVRLYKDNEGTASNGLLFTSTLSPTQYAALLVDVERLAGEQGYELEDVILSYGTLVMPMSNLLANDELGVPAGQFDVALYTELGLPFVQIPATAAGIIKNSETEGLEFRAALVNIPAKHYETVYVGIPYVTIELVGDDGTTVEKIVTYYPTFDTQKGTDSLSNVAARALNDNSAVKQAPYLYKSLTVKGAYSRYSAAQQQTLQGYLAHVHHFNHKGVCSSDECGNYNAATAFEVDTTKTLYCEIGDVKYYTLVLENGVNYNLQIANGKLATYKLYDEEGNECDVTDGRFACEADGSYYLVVTSRGFGTTSVSVTHLHNASYLGYCSACDKQLSVSLGVEQVYETNLVKGNTYYYSVVLRSGVDYTILAKNGEYVLYNANGDELEVEEGIFRCTADGTYYIIVTASFSTTGGLTINHSHAFNHKGECTYEGCDLNMSTELPKFYTKTTSVTAESGTTWYFRKTLEEGKVYSFRYNTSFVGRWAMYNEAGENVTANNFTCPETGTYYIVVTAQSKCAAQFWMEVEHEHTFLAEGVGQWHKRICTICSSDYSTTLRVETNYDVSFEAGQTYFYKFTALINSQYKITVPDNVEIRVCSGGGELPSYSPDRNCWYNPDTCIYFGSDTGRTVYLVIDAVADTTGVINISHSHSYNYKGECTSASCGSKLTQTLSANVPKTVTYTAGETYYYQSYMTAGTHYDLKLNNVDVSWVLLNNDGTSVDAELLNGSNFYCATSQTYYLLITAMQDSATGATIAMQSHTPDTNHLGECTATGCDWVSENILTGPTITSEQVIPLDEMAGTWYASIGLEAGNTYTFTFAKGSADSITYKFYDSTGAEVQLVDDTFVCETDGTYYCTFTVTGDATGATMTIDATATA